MRAISFKFLHDFRERCYHWGSQENEDGEIIGGCLKFGKWVKLVDCKKCPEYAVSRMNRLVKVNQLKDEPLEEG